MRHERTPTKVSRLAPDSDEVAYLAYIVGPDGEFLREREFGACHDEAALKLARQLGDYVELWTKAGRFIKKMRNTGFGVAARPRHSLGLQAMRHERTPTKAIRLVSDSDEVAYLAYIFGPDGQFLRQREFAACNDEAALKLARQLGDYVELWTKGGRFIVKLRK